MRTWVLLIAALLLQPGTAGASPSATPSQSQSGAIAGVVKDPPAPDSRRPRRSFESSPDRKDAHRCDRRPGRIQDHRAAAWHLCGDVHLAGLPHCEAGRHRGNQLVHSQGQHRDTRWDCGRDRDGSSESALLDTQNVSEKAVTSRQVMDTLPTDRNFTSFAALTPGMQVVAAGCRTSAERTPRTR